MKTAILYRQATQEDTDLTYGIKTRSIKPYVTAVYGWDEAFQVSFHQKTFNPENTRILLLKEGQSLKGAPPGNGEPENDEPENENGEPENSEPGQEVVFGYIEIEYREAEIFLANILIDGSFQGRGLGEIVMRQLIREADRPVRLEVFRVNRRARVFYERLGFRVTGHDKIKYIMERP